MPATHDTLKNGAPRARIVPGGLKANLAANREGTLRWVEEAPLRLVAAALLDAPRKQAKVGEIRGALTTEIIESGNWNRWWNVVRPRLQASRQFSYPKSKPIRLRASNLADVDSSSLDELRASSRASRNGSDKPSESEASAPSATASVDASKTGQGATLTPDIAGLGGWVLWVQADEGEEQPMPKSVPPTQFATFLGRQPKALVGRAVSRVASGIQQRVVESNNPSDKTIESWQESLVAALNRLSGVADQQDAALKEAVLITARVLEKHIRPEFQDVVEWMTAFTSVGDGSAKVMSDAILSASRTALLGTNRLLGRLSKMLDAPSRQNLWLEIMQSGLRTRKDVGLLQRWLGMLKSEERADAIIYLLRAVQGSDSVEVIDSMLRDEWEKSGSKQRARLSEAVELSWQLQRDEPIQNGLALNAAKPTAQMGAWLKVLEPDERYSVISHLIRAGCDMGMIEAIGPVLETEWKIADGEQRHRLFDSVALGWALHDGLRPKALDIMREALLDLVLNGPSRQESQLSELVEVVIEAARTEVERVRDEYERKLAETKQKLAETELKRDQYIKQSRHLQDQFRKERYKAALAIGEKAIKTLGYTLQRLDASHSPDTEVVADASAGIILALSALGAEPFGEVGSILPFDRDIHSADSPKTDAPVRVIARGVRYFRGEDIPHTMIKSQVEVEE